MSVIENDPPHDRPNDHSLLVSDQAGRARYKLKEVYQSYRSQDGCERPGTCIGTDNAQPILDDQAFQPYSRSNSPSDLSSVLEQVLRTTNASVPAQPIIQYNTYNIYQTEDKPASLMPPKADPHTQVDRLILAFVVVFFVVIFAFSFIICFLVKKLGKNKKKKKSEEKSLRDSDNEKLLEEKDSISTSELGLPIGLPFALADKSSRSLASRKQRLVETDFFAPLKKEGSSKSRKAKDANSRPEQPLEKFPSIGSPDSAGSTPRPPAFASSESANTSSGQHHSSHLNSGDFTQLLKNTFGEKVTSVLPELNHGLEHSKSFLTSPDLPEYENGRFRNNFYSIKEIGQGSFGRVFRAFHKLEEKVYAIKCIEFTIKEGQDPRMDSTLREIYAMSDLKHDNVVRYITCWMEREEADDSENESPKHSGLASQFGKKSAMEPQVLVEENQPFNLPSIQPISNKQYSGLEFEFGGPISDINIRPEGDPAFNYSEGEGHDSEGQPDPKLVTIYLYIQMEFCKGLSLLACMETEQFHLSQVDVYCIFSQVVDGLAYIHSKGLIHRDIKPGNIFVEASGMLKIGDFGLVIHQHKLPTVTTVDAISRSQVQLKRKFDKTQQPEGDETEYAGSPLYSFPEAIDGQTMSDSSADLYATGIVLFELLSAFRAKVKKVQEIKALKKARRTNDAFRSKFPHEARIIDMLIGSSKADMPTAAGIKSSEAYREWTAKIQSLIAAKND